MSSNRRSEPVPARTGPANAAPAPAASSVLARASADAAAARRAGLRLLLSSALFALMAAGTKLATRRLPGPEVALARFLAGIVVVLIAVAFGWAYIRPRRWGWLGVRGFFGGASVVAYFVSIKATPVGVATLLNQTQPVFTMLFSWALLAERPRRGALAALALALAGVAVIVGVRHFAFHAWRGELIGALSAVGSGMAVTAIRAARRDGDRPGKSPGPAGPRDAGAATPPETAFSVFFSFTLLGALVSLPFVLPPLGTWLPPSPTEWALLGAVGLAGVAAQLIMTEALRHMTGVQSGIISQLTVPMTVTLGLVFLGERLSAGFLAGAALILSGVAMTLAAAPSRVARTRL